MNKYHLPQALVMDQVNTGGNNFLLTVEAPEIARTAQPGQFVHLRAGEYCDPLLRRPISICRADREKGIISLWYQVVGRGTILLSRLKTGMTLDVMGPLGKGFTRDIPSARGAKKAYLIGGGMGIAPLCFLGGELAEKMELTGFWGARNKEQFPPPVLYPPGSSLWATEDGSMGHKGFVTALLEERLAAAKSGAKAAEKADMLYACGPRPMLHQVNLLAQKHNLPLQVSLEAAMACGVGACLGCTCEKKGEQENQVNSGDSQGRERGGGWLKACLDGPVFWAGEVKWE